MYEPFLVFGFMYAEPRADFGTERDSFIYCGVNSHWEPHTLELPALPEGMRWYLRAYSADSKYVSREIRGGRIELTARSAAVLVGE